MCEASVYLREGALESLFLQGLDVLEVNGDFIEMSSLFGEKKRVRARLIGCLLVDHKIILEANSEA
jgi:predicted RNA-binding protein